MAVLFAVTYPDQETAAKAFDTLDGLEEGGFAKVMESLYLVKEADGDVKTHDAPHGRGRAVGIGAIVGGVAGMLFAAPMVGAAIGGAVGGIFGGDGANIKDDIDAFTEVVGKTLQPGGSAVIALVGSESPERVAKEMGQWGGTLVSTDLSDKQIKQIQAMIDRSAPAG